MAPYQQQEQMLTVRQGKGREAYIYMQRLVLAVLQARFYCECHFMQGVTLHLSITLPMMIHYRYTLAERDCQII
jgi:hypothetical protein